MIFRQENRLYSIWTRYKMCLFLEGPADRTIHDGDFFSGSSLDCLRFHTHRGFTPAVLSADRPQRLSFWNMGRIFLRLFSHPIIHTPLDGRKSHRSWEEIVLFYAFGLLIGLLVDRERMESQRRQDQEHLAVLGEAAATVAHELKNPVITIGANILRMQKKAEPGDPNHARLGLIYQECQRVELLLKDMVNFARPIDLNFEPTDVNALVRKVIEMVIPQAQKKQVELSANLDGNLPVVLTDQTRITQVFYNLIMNAVQASMTEQRILIRTEKKKNQISVEFSDSGAVFPRICSQKFLIPFFQRRRTGRAWDWLFPEGSWNCTRGSSSANPTRPRGLFLPSSCRSKKVDWLAKHPSRGYLYHYRRFNFREIGVVFGMEIGIPKAPKACKGDVLST